MKKALLTLSLSVTAVIASAQKTIVSPRYSASNVATLSIEKIVLADTATLLTFRSTSPANSWFRIASGNYITAGDKKYTAKSVSGIQFNKEIHNTNGPTEFTVAFKPVQPDTKSIDYIEGDCERCFKFFDVELTAAKKQIMPASFYTNWFQTNGSKQWVLGITNKKVIYDSQVWDNTVQKVNGDTYKLILKKGKINRILFLKQDQNGTLAAWEGNKPKIVLSSNVADTKFALANDKPFSLPLIKYDSAGFSGYIKGYSPKLGFKTGILHINNVISGEQESHAFVIQPDGTFHTNIYMSNPEECFLDMGDFYGTVFIGPGKKTFQYLDLSKKNERQFMGEYATINNELIACEPLKDLNYDRLYETAAQLEPAQFQEYIVKMRDDALERTDRYRAEKGLSMKGYQVIAMNANYKTAEMILDYNSLRDRDHRKKTNAGPNQVESGYVPVKLDSGYLQVLKKFPLNDDASVITHEYESFINRLRFNSIVRARYYSVNGDKAKMSQGKILSTLMDLEPGLTTDVVTSQDIYYDIDKRSKIKKADDWTSIKTQLATNTVYTALTELNKIVETKILNKNASLTKTPRTAAEKVFAGILKKHQGKAVFVDFWATWCAPCRVGIEHIAPLKEELKNENIAFVYITDTSSPTALYNKMIPDIKGDHHRLSKDDWNLIASQYGISAIPRYMMFSKNGVMTTGDYRGGGNEMIKNDLMKLAKE